MKQGLPKKSLGQHWLNNQSVLNEIIAAGNISSSDVVLEIGPGQGSLTKKLLQKAGSVVAVELDSTLATMLTQRFNTPSLSVVQEDILKFDFSTMPPNYKVVANIPYYLTNHLFRVLYESPNPPSLAVLLVQKEVAERVVAKPGQMSILAVSLQLKNEVSLGVVVPAVLFEPPPKVDSQVVILKLRAQPLFKDLDEQKFFNIVKAGFSAKRKKLRSALAGGLRIPKSEASKLLGSASVDENLRAQNLSLQDWYKIYLLAK